MNLIMNKVGIFTTNLEKMVLFYRDVIGMKTSWDFKSKNAELTSGNMSLIFYPREDFEKMVSKKFNYPKEDNGTFELSFQVDTFKAVDRKFNEIVKKGAQVLLKPTTQVWGQRTCYIKDPEQNLIEISSFIDLKETLDSQRLHFRSFNDGDIDDVFEYSKDEETVKYLTWPAHKDKDTTKFSLDNFLKKEGVFALVEKSLNKVIGCFDIRFESEKRVVFGYVLNKKFWNKGYMSEALNTIIDYCFNDLGFEEIEGLAEIENIASKRVMQKCNMKLFYQGKNETLGEKVVDMNHYIIYKRDYLKK